MSELWICRTDLVDVVGFFDGVGLPDGSGFSAADHYSGGG